MPRLLIDTDTGSDDAVALVMALKDPVAKVEAVTVVAGNVPLEQGTQNALYTLELCGSDVPPNVEVVTKASRGRFLEILHAAVAA